MTAVTPQLAYALTSSSELHVADAQSPTYSMRDFGKERDGGGTKGTHRQSVQSCAAEEARAEDDCMLGRRMVSCNVGVGSTCGPMSTHNGSEALPAHRTCPAGSGILNCRCEEHVVSDWRGVCGVESRQWSGEIALTRAKRTDGGGS